MVRKSAFSVAAFFCLIVFPQLAYALPKLSAQVVPKSGSIDQVFRFELRVEDAANAPAPNLIGGDDFEIDFVGPQTSVTIINGNFSHRISYIYTLKPKKLGLLSSPTAEITADGQKLTTSPIPIKVETASNRGNIDSGLHDSVFIQQRTSIQTPYIGQQVLHTNELYAATDLYEPQFAENTFDGFWHEKIEPDENSERYVKGKNYRVISMRTALYPLASGELKLPERVITASIREARRRKSSNFPFGGLDLFQNDLFDDFFGATSIRQVKLRSQPLTLEVRSLPPAPPNFVSGDLAQPIVGKTLIAVEYEPSDIKVGESKTIRVKVSSEGNLNPLKTIPFPESDLYKTYLDNPQLEKEFRRGLVRSHRTFSVSLVGIKEGTIDIPSLPLGYFDPSSDSYRTTESIPISFKVLPDPSIPNLPPKLTATEPKSEDATKSQPLETDQAVEDGGTFEEGSFAQLKQRFSSGTLLLLGVSLVLFGIVVSFGFWLAVRTRKRRHLITKIKRATSYNELNRILREFLSLTLSGEATSKTLQELDAYARTKIADADIQFEAIALLSQLEAHVYGDSSDDSSQITAVKKRIISLVKSLE